MPKTLPKYLEGAVLLEDFGEDKVFQFEIPNTELALRVSYSYYFSTITLVRKDFSVGQSEPRPVLLTTRRDYSLRKVALEARKMTEVLSG